jgi:cathepsin E
MVPTTLLTTLLLAFVIAAEPIIRAESFGKLPITRRVNSATGSNIVRQDQQRAETLKSKGDAIANGDIEALQSLAVSNATSSPVENQVVFYIASVGVGSPATQCK